MSQDDHEGEILVGIGLPSTRMVRLPSRCLTIHSSRELGHTRRKSEMAAMRTLRPKLTPAECCAGTEGELKKCKGDLMDKGKLKVQEALSSNGHIHFQQGDKAACDQTKIKIKSKRSRLDVEKCSLTTSLECQKRVSPTSPVNTAGCTSRRTASIRGPARYVARVRKTKSTL